MLYRHARETHLRRVKPYLAQTVGKRSDCYRGAAPHFARVLVYVELEPRVLHVKGAARRVVRLTFRLAALNGGASS